MTRAISGPFLAPDGGTKYRSRRGNVLDTDSDFWRFTFDVRRYHTWEERHTIFLSSLTTLQTGTVGVDIPIYSDFHIGGTNTIRGFELDSRSGKNQFINTAEYRFMLVEPRPISLSFFRAYIGVQLASFVDLGHAWDLGHEFASNQFIGGYGMGVRLPGPVHRRSAAGRRLGSTRTRPDFPFWDLPESGDAARESTLASERPKEGIAYTCGDGTG